MRKMYDFIFYKYSLKVAEGGIGKSGSERRGGCEGLFLKLLFNGSH